MPKFRKKPVVIEAVQLSLENIAEVTLLMGLPETNYATDEKGQISTLIPTLEGNMIAKQGDYIIRGIKGELYPCKPDIFEATYEPAE